MCSGKGDWTCLQPGFPIRKSSDHSLVIDYPRLIADSYVLLRFLVPRHPPCALKNLATKMLASTVKFSKYNRHPAPDTAKLRHRQGPRPEETSRHTHPRAVETTRAGTCRPILQDPTTCQAPTRTTPRSTAEHPPRGTAAACTSAMTRPAPNNRCSTLEHPLPHTRGQTGLCTDQE